MAPPARQALATEDSYSNDIMPKQDENEGDNDILDFNAVMGAQAQGEGFTVQIENITSNNTVSYDFASIHDPPQRSGRESHGSRESDIPSSGQAAPNPAQSSPRNNTVQSSPDFMAFGRTTPTVPNIKEGAKHNPASSEDLNADQSLWLNASKKMVDAYEYSAIQPTQVRLLVIPAGQKHDDDINAILAVVEDKDLGAGQYCYEALSYHWGDAREDHEIMIQDAWSTKQSEKFLRPVLSKRGCELSGAKRLNVRPNLYSALKRLRTLERSVVLWVDAICIDQANDAEKTVQVMKMNEIHQKAFNVCVWLGPDDSDCHSSEALTFIKYVIDLERLDHLLTDDMWLPAWQNLLKLLTRGWFSRRWVIQELALARNATIHCGHSQVHAIDFRDAISIFQRYLEVIQPKLQARKLGGMMSLQALGARRLLESTGDLFNRKGIGSSDSLERLVSRLSSFVTSDPRDTINCLRNISKELDGSRKRRPNDQRRLPPPPNYTQDLFEVYRDFVEWVIEDSQALDIICRHWALKEKSFQADHGPTAAPRLVKLPSWIIFFFRYLSAMQILSG